MLVLLYHRLHSLRGPRQRVTSRIHGETLESVGRDRVLPESESGHTLEVEQTFMKSAEQVFVLTPQGVALQGQRRELLFGQERRWAY